jgi:hypothetical protein
VVFSDDADAHGLVTASFSAEEPAG